MARAGAKKKPTTIKKLQGNPSTKKLPKYEPTIKSSIPDAPDYLDERALEEWFRLAPDLHRIGLLTKADAHIFAGYCQAVGDWAWARKKIKEKGLFPGTKGDAVSGNNANGITKYKVVADKALDQMRKFIVEFGLSPSARATMGTDTPPGENKLASLVKKH